MSPQRQMPRQVVKLGAVVAASVLALSGCSSSGDGKKDSASTQSGSATGSGPVAGGASGKPISVGVLCTCSGPAGVSGNLSPKVLDAWTQQTNATGGINGHPVKVVLEDDASNPATSLQNAKKLVEQDKVAAIIAFTQFPTAATYLKASNVPLIGIDATGGAFSFPTFFAVGADLNTGQVALLDIAKRAGKKTYDFLYCSEAAACAQANGTKQKISKVLGIKYKGYSISGSAPDYTAQCLAAKQDGAEVVEVGHSPAVLQKIASQCGSQQYKPLYIGGPYADSNEVLKDSSLNGLSTWSSAANYQSTLPGAVKFSDAMKKYANSSFTAPDFQQYYSDLWASAEMFKAAAKAGKLDPNSKPADALSGLYALKNETLGGLVPPTTYEKGKFWKTGCYFNLVIDNGKLSGGDKPVCVDPAAMAAAG